MENAWKNFVSDYLQKNGSPILESIFKNTYFSSFFDNKIFVACKNLGTKVVLENKKTEIEKNFSIFLGKPVSLVFFIKPFVEKKTKNDPPLLKHEKEKQTLINRAGLLENFTFENFAVSSSNQLAYSAALAVCQKLGKLYNPLFIYGDVGVGKTHLMQAIGNKVLEKDPNKKILFCSSEDFLNDLIQVIRTKNTLSFRKKYRSLDLLMVDDIQFIAGKTTIQEEFFHTFNSIIRGGGQIVLTSDRPPKEIKNLQDRLKSRFAGGLTVDIQKPDLELRTAIVLIKAKERNIDIDFESAELIAQKITDTRELEGRLLEMSAKAIRENKKISKELIESEFSKQKNQIIKKVSPQEIIRIVCSYYNLKPSQIKKPTRKEQVSFPRQIIMYLLRNVLKLKYEEIAFILKRKDHTTIIHGVDKINALIIKNPGFKNEIDRIINSFY